MNRNTIIPIFFACDNQYTKYTMVAMKSMIENASKEYTYHMHILHTDVSAAMQERVKELENANTRIYFDDVTERMENYRSEIIIHILRIIVFLSRICIHSMTRLFILTVIPLQ